MKMRRVYNEHYKPTGPNSRLLPSFGSPPRSRIEACASIADPSSCPRLLLPDNLTFQLGLDRYSSALTFSRLANTAAQSSFL